MNGIATVKLPFSWVVPIENTKRNQYSFTFSEWVGRRRGRKFNDLP
jgi:hypothetical protein